MLASNSGLDRGFDHYDDAVETGGADEQVSLGQAQRRGDDTLTRVEQWLDARPEVARATRTALWIHLYDPHDPYEPPEPFATKFAARPYDGEVAWTDTLLGRLRASLESRQLWDDALVVVTADHGESLGEHGETGPRVLRLRDDAQDPVRDARPRGAGRPGGRRAAAGSSTWRRRSPTCSVCRRWPGPPARASCRYLAAGAPPLTATTYAESLTPLVHYQWSDLRVLRDGTWKYILAPRPELYDLAADPGESRDLAATSTATARRLRASLEGLLRAERERALDPAGDRPAVSAETLQKLGALGYVSPGAPSGSVAQGADPKDKIEEFSTLSGLMREGLTLLREKHFAESAARFTRLREVGADSFQLHFYLGEALAGLGRHREADASYTRSAVIMPSFAQAHLSLAESRISRNDLRGAIAALQQGQKDAPNEPLLLDREGQVWQTLGDAERAMTAYRRVETMAPARRPGQVAHGRAATQPATARPGARRSSARPPRSIRRWPISGTRSAWCSAARDQHRRGGAAFREADHA